MPFVDYHPTWGKQDREFRASTAGLIWERFRVAALGNMDRLSEVQRAFRWHVWQAVTFGGGIKPWIGRGDEALSRLPGENLAYRMQLAVEAHREIHSLESQRLSQIVDDQRLLNDLLRAVVATTMYARAATLQLGAVAERAAGRRGGILGRWRAGRASTVASEGLVLAVMNVWGQWPHDWWETGSGIGNWRPDQSALGHLMDLDSNAGDPGVSATAVDDARTASEVLGWLTMAGLASYLVPS